MTTTSAPTPTPTKDSVSESSAIGHDDYAMSRVPQEKRYSWISVAMQRFGQLSALAQFLLAASIGVGMDFWDAMLAILLGSIFLQVVTIFIGIAGMREGLSTSVLARWSGFGLIGAALVGLAMAISLIGWFAVQNEVFAVGLHAVWSGLPVWVYCIVGGLVVTAVVAHGFKSMNWVAWITVPAFLALCLWAITDTLTAQPLSSMMQHHGEPLSLAAATTFVAGGFIAGAIFTPDMSRFNKSASDVVKQTVVGVTFGEFFVGVIGVLLAHALKLTNPNDAGAVIGIIQSSSGALGVLILCVSIIKVNDWNLYPSSLGVVSAVRGLFGVRLNRAAVAIVLGTAATILSATGFASHFQDFLTELGILFPPIAAVIIADYFVLRTWRKDLDESRAQDKLPSTVPVFVPAGLIAWATGYAFGKYSAMNPDFLDPYNVPAITSLAVTFVVCVVLGKLGLAKGIGHRSTYATNA